MPRYAALVAALARSTPPSVARAASSSSFSCETIASSRVRDFSAVPARANAAAKASDGARKRLRERKRSGAELSTPRTPQNAPAHCAAFSSFSKGARFTPSFWTAQRVSRSTRRRGSRSRSSDPNLKPSRSRVSMFDLSAASPTAFADVARSDAVCSVSKVCNNVPTSRAVSALHAMSRALMDANFETRGGRATTCATAKPPTRSKEGRMPWTCSSDAARGLTVPSQLPRTSRSTNDFGSFASNLEPDVADLGVVEANQRAREEGQRRPAPGRVEGRQVVQRRRRRRVERLLRVRRVLVPDEPQRRLAPRAQF